MKHIRYFFSVIMITLFGLSATAQYSLRFDGGDAATINSGNLLGTQPGDPFTIEAWVNHDGQLSTGYNAIFSSGTTVDDRPFFGTTNRKLVLYRSGNVVQADIDLPPSQWVHVAVTYDGTTAKLYQNGQMVKSATSANLDFTGPTYYFWGYSDGDTQWNGMIDEMIIWNTARTDAEIQSDMVKESLTGTETGLVVYFDANEGTGQTLNNKVSGGPDGVLGDDNTVEPDDPTWIAKEPPGDLSKHSLYFDGGDHVTMVESNLLGNSPGAPFSIEAWVYHIGAFPGGSVAIFDSNVDDYPFFGTNGSSLQFFFQGNNIQSNPIVTADDWVHVAATYDGTTIRLYLNGKEVKSAGPYTNLFFQNTTSNTWGKSPGNTQWNGFIDEMMVWNVARTEAQIQYDMIKESLDGTEPGLRVYYDANEGTGQTLNNKVSGGVNGVLGSTSSEQDDDPKWSFNEPPVILGPGGVFGANLWLDAGNGASNSGTDLTGWVDLTATNVFTQVGTPGYASNGLNFNPSVSFDNTNPRDQLPPKRLDGNTAITFKEGFAVVKNNDNFSTLVGSTVVGPTNGLGIFSSSYATQTIISAVSGDQFDRYKGLEVNEEIKDHRVLNLDIDGTPGTGRINGVSYPLDAGSGTFTSLSITPMIGGTNNGTGGGGEESFNGEVSEIILFAESLTAAEKVRVESYLALKYGIQKTGNYVSSTETILWDATANAAFTHDVFGIGKDPLSSLNQTQSNSYNTGSGDGTGQSGKGNIVLSNPSSLDDGDFLLIGHDNASWTMINTDLPNDLAGAYRVAREWKVRVTGTPGTVDLSTDLVGANYPNTLVGLVMLIDEDGNGDFTDGTVTRVNPDSFNAGGKVQYNGITLNEGVVFTFMLRSEIAWTGNVDTDWSKAGNWSGSFVPGPVDDVTIPSGLTNYPVVGTSMTGANAARCFNMTVADGATVTVDGELIMKE